MISAWWLLLVVPWSLWLLHVSVEAGRAHEFKLWADAMKSVLTLEQSGRMLQALEENCR